jgi:6-phosphogluconolactonase
MKLRMLSISLLVWAISSAQLGKSGSNEHYLLVGTYTSGKSEGIYVYKFNSTSGSFSQVSTVKADNPSFLAVSPDEQFVFAVNENGNDKGSIASYSFDKKTGQLVQINKESSGGDHPCYVNIDGRGNWVVSGNYTGGSLAVLPVMDNGKLLPAHQVIEHEGQSVNKQRQEKAHVHATVFSPDYKYLFVPDLGIDKIMIYSFDQNSGRLDPSNATFTQTEPGSGPRHFTFHPSGNYAYLMEELSGKVNVFSYNKQGKLTSMQTISAIPADYKGNVGSADIHVSPDGKFLYASNRGESNTLAIFSIDQNGKLTLVGHQSTLGNTPRNFNFDPTGNFLLVANQNGNNIVIFKVDKKTGLLMPLPTQIEVPNPVCIKWAGAM